MIIELDRLTSPVALAAFVGVASAALAGEGRTAPAETWSDPFAYCAAVGTIDAPDARYTGPAVPEAVARGLQQAFGVASSAPLETFERGTSWRCLDGALYACNVGANLPCDEKPAADPAVSDAMRSFCAESPGSDVIPMYVTGHATIYDWSCDGKEPRRGRRVAELDPRGYVASIWHRISAPSPSPSPPRTR